MSKNKKISIGIDLGTTYSCVGIYKGNGVIDIIANDQGNRTTPSFVSFTDEERYIGEAAKTLCAQNAKNTVYDAKRIIGKKYSDESVQADIKHFSFDVSGNEDDKPIIEVDYMGERKKFCPEEISAMILTKMKNIAEAYVGTTIKDAVVTVPAYFNDAQKQATQDAGKIAGLNVLRIINEPTAAALAYGLHEIGERNVLIFDLGGGTLDVTVLTMENGVFEVKSVSGDTHLGGEDFDNNIKDYVLMVYGEKKVLKTRGLKSEEKTAVFDKFGVRSLSDMISLSEKALTKTYKEFTNKQREFVESIVKFKDLMNNSRSITRLKAACENAKKILSSATTTTINIESFYDGDDLNVPIARTKFEDICEDDFIRCMAPVEKALKDAKMLARDIHDVVLVGGSTRIPKIQALLNEKFPGKIKSNINPDEAVAYGAAVQAAILSGVRDNTTDSIVLLDVTPLSLGIETAGGIMETMIKRNTPIPCEKEESYSTYSDNQPGVTIKIYEGERTLTKDNNLLGVFELKGIPPMPKGTPKIKVTFKVDNNGIMTVSAMEESSGKANNIIVENNKGRLNEKDIDKMVNDAKMFAENDKKAKERVEAKNSLENYMATVRRTIDEEAFKMKMGEAVCKIINDELTDCTTWIEDYEELSSKEEFDEQYKRVEAVVLPFIKQYCGEKIFEDYDEESEKEKSKEKSKDKKQTKKSRK